MSKKTILITAATIAGFAANSFSPEQSAVGSVRAPAAYLESPFSDRLVEAKPSMNSGAQKKKSFLSKVKDRWAKFRPVAKSNSLEMTPVYSSKTTIEELFDEEFTARMRNEHAAMVVPAEKEALNPYRRSSHWEMRRYEDSRKALAEWTMKELGRDQLKEFIRMRKKDSAALGIVAATTGVEEVGQSNSTQTDALPAGLTEKERLARAHAYTPESERAEEVIPTRLRARLNVLKTQGQVTFMNPVVTTSVEARAGAGENISVEMKRDFKKLELNSHVRYAVDQSRLVLNVNKKITDEVSLDLNSERWTGSKRGDAGEKSKGTAKVTYSISF